MALIRTNTRNVEISTLSRSFYNFFKVTSQETEFFTKVFELRADQENAASEKLEEYQTKSRALFEAGKTHSSHLKMMNSSLREELMFPFEHRKDISNAFSAQDSPGKIIQDWNDKYGNEGRNLYHLSKKTLKKYEAIRDLLAPARKVLENKLEELDLNQTLQGKHGGSLQGLERMETTKSKKRRLQLESQEERLRFGIDKAIKKYHLLIENEINARISFMKTFSAIREQAEALERKRLSVIAKAYNRYIDIVEAAEAMNDKREAVIKHMRGMAASFKDVNMIRFNKWVKEKTKLYKFQLFTINWTLYGLGIVTNDIPDIEIPDNLQPPSEPPSSNEAVDSQSSYNDAPSSPIEKADAADQQATKPDGQEAEQPQSASNETTVVEILNQDHFQVAEESTPVEVLSQDHGMGARPKVRVVMCGPAPEEVHPSSIVPCKANRRQVRPKPTPAKSSDRRDVKAKPKSRGSTSEDTDSEKELEHVQSGRDLIPRDTITSPTQGTKDWIPYTGCDQPYYAEGDPEDLETPALCQLSNRTTLHQLSNILYLALASCCYRSFIFRFSKKKFLEYLLSNNFCDFSLLQAPFEPMINNWVDPKKSGSSPNRLNQFVAKTKAKLFRPSKKSKKPASPEIEDTETVPVEYGCDAVDEVTAFSPPPSGRKSKGDKAPPATPGPSKSVKKTKKAAPAPKPSESEEEQQRVGPSGSESSCLDVETLKAKSYAEDKIKTYSVAAYEAKRDNEISFVAGQTVKLIYPANAKGMAFGYTRSSRMESRHYGFFPEELVVDTIQERYKDRSIRRNLNGFFKKR
ncbi:uncharacterized protein [Argopecten irradians]|uniref:uncharacterized protein n=1 Tax=Argopecten irradians TaxID=31199 RepID=UPI003718E465